MMQKRTALKLVLAGAAAAMLAGCGDKTEAPKEAAAPEKTAGATADKAGQQAHLCDLVRLHELGSQGRQGVSGR